jgi:hypothetical protein
MSKLPKDEFIHITLFDQLCIIILPIIFIISIIIIILAFLIILGMV